MAEIKNSIRRFILINKIFLKKSVWIAKRENSYQTMTAAGTAKRKNSPTPTKAFLEKEMRVFSQAEEYLTKDKSNITLNQTQRLKEIAAPTCPNSNLNTRVQHVAPWKHKAMAEVRIMGEIKLWVWKNRVRGLRIAEPNRAGISQMAYLRTSRDIVGSWPNRVNILSLKIHRIVIGKQTKERDIMAV